MVHACLVFGWAYIMAWEWFIQTAPLYILLILLSGACQGWQTIPLQLSKLTWMWGEVPGHELTISSITRVGPGWYSPPPLRSDSFLPSQLRWYNIYFSLSASATKATLSPALGSVQLCMCLTEEAWGMPHCSVTSTVPEATGPINATVPGNHKMRVCVITSDWLGL